MEIEEKLTNKLDSLNLKRLKNIFKKDIDYSLDTLNRENLLRQEDKYRSIKALVKEFKNKKRNIIKANNRNITLNNIDYLLKKYFSYLSKDGDTSLYENIKEEILFEGDTTSYLLIAGDFFGIQKFIFSGVTTKYASKVLRAKSAFIQIFIKTIAIYIAEELNISYLNIITTNAGKFEILSPIKGDKNRQEKILKSIQSELNNFFVREYFGESGVGISWIECKREDFNSKKSYKALRDRLATKVELKKFSKFNLQSMEPLMEYDEDIDNQNLCEFCNKRKGEIVEEESGDKIYTICSHCRKFVDIGKNLATKRYILFTKNNKSKTAIDIYNNYSIEFKESIDISKIDENILLIFDISKEDSSEKFAKWELSSYVKTDKNRKIYTFGELAECSCGRCKENSFKKDEGIEAIIALKADVDGMGNFIKNSSITDSFTKFNFFSRIVDYFFSVYVPYIMQKKYSNTYTIFAGGDDLFLIGAWDEVIELAKEVERDFKEFANPKESSLSISMGLILTKPTRPINYIAQIAESALEDAKEFCCIRENGICKEIIESKECESIKEREEKDAITLFGETLKWENYLTVYKTLEESFDKYHNITTSTLYRLLDFCEMSKEVKYKNNILATMWKSKLNYLFYRNMNIEKDKKLMKTLSNKIENYPKETKVFLVEFIYKRRKV